MKVMRQQGEETTIEPVDVETACADVQSVVMCDDRLRVDDIVIRAGPEAAVDPVHLL